MNLVCVAAKINQSWQRQFPLVDVEDKQGVVVPGEICAVHIHLGIADRSARNHLGEFKSDASLVAGAQNTGISGVGR